uniref:Uncharacterized protein n=1 Tax=viral metagenome TaxID=1070528 RepID=A0A6C0DDQ4_9ZZZZ
MFPIQKMNDVEKYVEISHGKEDMSAGEGLIEMEHKEDHDAIMSLISGDAMTGAELILHDSSLPIPVKITKLLGIIMTLLESVQLNGAKISGTVKKAVSLQLLTRLIHFVASDSKDFDDLIHLSQIMGPDILETLIEVSKGVNLTAVEKHKETCCFGLLSK